MPDQQLEEIQPPIPIPPPGGDLSEIPDSATKRALDFTGTDAANRILYINCGIFRYGTDDKAHAASIILSILLLAVAVFIIVVGLWATNTAWLEKVLSWIGTAFVFVAGVSIGRGGKDSPDH